MLQDFLNSLSIFVQSGLFIDEIKHGLVSFVFASIFFYKTKNIKLSALIIFITYIIDSDHLVDYFLYYGLADFSFTKFLTFDYFKNTGRAIVPFHAWEWVLLISLLASQQTQKYKVFLYAIAAGIFAHLCWDMMTVGSFRFYSILYRISHSFIVIN